MDDGGDRMFCHQCGSIWLRRAESGLVCPYCESDFTEIVSIKRALKAAGTRGMMADFFFFFFFLAD